MLTHLNLKAARQSYDSVVPIGSDVRVLDRVLGLIRDDVIGLLCEPYSNKVGRPTRPPEQLFRVLLLQHLMGLGSTRKACDRLNTDFSFRWFVGLARHESPPHHSTVSRALHRWSLESLTRVFDRIRGLFLSKVRGWQKTTILGIDASLIEANHRKRGFSQDYIKKSDASFVGRKAYPGLYYKGHFVQCLRSGFIFDTYVTTGSTHESKIASWQLARVYKRIRDDLPISVVVGDRAYASSEIYLSLREMKINPAIPPNVVSTVERRRSGFFFDEYRNHYRCHQGRVLRPIEYSENKSYQTYAISRSECEGCSHKKYCLPPKSNRTITRSKIHHFLERIKRYTDRLQVKKLMRLRFTFQEGTFGTLKTQHGLRRANYRSIEKVRKQVLLIASVWNLKKIYRFCTDKGFRRKLYYGIDLSAI